MLTPLNKWPDVLAFSEAQHALCYSSHDQVFHKLLQFIGYSMCSAVIKAMESITNNEIWFIVKCIYNKMH